MKKKKGILFLLCFAGGVLFGTLFFALFGIEAGYSWFLAGLCAAGGLIFAVASFLIWLIVEKRSKPINFENLAALRKLQEFEQNFEPFDSYMARFHARISYGRGLKAAVCETYIYLFAERLQICFYYYRKIYTVEVDYKGLVAHADDEGFFGLEWQSGIFGGRLIDDEAAVFNARLKEKGVRIQEEDPAFEI